VTARKGAAPGVVPPSVSSSSPHDLDRSPQDLDRQACRLYRRYGALPWADLPEGTRAHFRDLVRAGIDGSGRPLA
jgi:hypothetical protein